MSVTKIGIFQLENLRANPVSYLFFDLRTESERKEDAAILSVQAQNLVDGAWHVDDVEQVQLHAKERGEDKSFPLVLICHNGKKSLRVGQIMVEMGYVNVVVLEGGTTGLRQ